jgi:hypothetical protein
VIFLNSDINPLIAMVLNMIVWGLGYVYLGKFFKGTWTFFLFAIACGFYLIYVLIAGFSFSLLLEILAGHFLTSLWFGYDAYSMAFKIKERY